MDGMRRARGRLSSHPHGLLAPRWWLYYTGLARDGVQRVGLAASDDLHRWEKRGLLVEADPVVYEREHWRDPWVLEVDGRAHMLLCARAARGPEATRGVIGHAVRDDDGVWVAARPLSEPGDYFQLEVPQVLHLGGAWRVLFCTEHGEQWGTHYLTGPSPLGPFTLDRPDFLAGDAAGSHYAGRVLEHGGRRHFFAWRQHDARGAVPGRAERSDGAPRRPAAVGHAAVSASKPGVVSTAVAGEDRHRLVAAQAGGPARARLPHRERGGGVGVGGREVGADDGDGEHAARRPARVRVDDVLAALVGARGGDGAVASVSDGGERGRGRAGGGCRPRHGPPPQHATSPPASTQQRRRPRVQQRGRAVDRPALHEA